MRLKLGATIVLVLASFAATGCGTGESDEDAVKSTVSGYLSAFADGDGDKACEYLTGDGSLEITQLLASNIPGEGILNCPEAVEKASGFLGTDEKKALEDPRFADVNIEGDTATVSAEGGGRDVTLTKVDGDWLIDSGFVGQ